MKPKSSEGIFTDKVMLVIRISLSIIVIIFGILQVFKIYEKAIYYTIPLSGIYLIILSIQEWKHDKRHSLLSVGLAVIIFGVYYYIWR